MSRLIIKNLPPYITEPKLLSHLQSKPQAGELTDVKIVHKKDGSTRRLAFIGYKTEDQAAAAKEYFDSTYLDISKLRVEFVTGVKDAPDLKKRKRPHDGAEGEEDRSKKRQKLSTIPITSDSASATEKKKKGDKADRLDEFTKLMSTNSNAKPSWAADVDSNTVPSTKAKTKKDKTKVTKEKKKKEDSPMEEDQVEEVSDMEWMRRRMVSSDITEDKGFEQDDSDDEGKDKEKPEVEGSKADENPTHTSILSNGRLFVRNLVFSCKDSELKDHFAKFGDVEEVHLPEDGTGSPKGFAYIRFKDPTHAVTAYDALDGTSFQGRLLHILPAVDRNPRPTNGTAQNGKAASLKQSRDQKKKENSGKDFNWAVLYMNSDAVANSIAERLGIPKSDILNPDGSTVGGSPAVKLALAETHIIAETKKYFEQYNVDLSLFSKPRIPRSKSIILVKNIPYGTTVTQLQELFDQYGSVKRVLLPPAGTIAIVEYPEGREKEAGEAWRSLAYNRLKDSIIYLEWAPEGLFDASVVATKEGDGSSTTPAKEALKDIEDDEDVPPGATLYVGNLSFATTSARLSSIFKNIPSFAFAKVAVKLDSKHPGQTLSQGFGFVGFKDVEGAKNAIKGVGNGLVLDGHVLRISFAGRGKEDEEKSGVALPGKDGKKGTKIIVKNLAFEVSRKELLELFSAHGQIKSIRLPNRADRRSRGFAFVDYATRKEAENAMERLRHTHLLGRHLVMEWAEKEKGAEEMRLQTMVQFGDGAGSKDLGRKEKLRFGGGDKEAEEMDES